MDSNQYMCENPLTNIKNASRIKKKIISQLKLNTDSKRVGPKTKGFSLRSVMHCITGCKTPESL